MTSRSSSACCRTCASALNAVWLAFEGVAASPLLLLPLLDPAVVLAAAFESALLDPAGVVDSEEGSYGRMGTFFTRRKSSITTHSQQRFSKPPQMMCSHSTHASAMNAVGTQSHQYMHLRMAADTTRSAPLVPCGRSGLIATKQTQSMFLMSGHQTRMQ